MRRPKQREAEEQACFAEFDGVPTTFLEIDVATGAVRELYHNAKFGCIHVQPCPADPDLLLIDRDAPPSWKDPVDGGIPTRHWLFHTRTRQFTELRPRNLNRLQIHSVWNGRGDRTFYHGHSGGGMYVGVWDLKRRDVLWEQDLPVFLYGHTSSHPARDLFISDGLYTRDHIVAIHYEELDRFGSPRLEILGYHGSDMSDYPRYGHACHPHCHVSPDGRWIAYNRADDGRTDIYVLELDNGKEIAEA